MTKIGQLQPDYEQPCINTQTKTMFKVGDKVRIKSREQMEKEFGLDSYGNGNINCLNTFNKTMKPLCGMTGIIYRATPYDIELIDRSYNIDISDWALSIDMIELIEENKTEQERKPTPLEKMIDYANGCKYCDPQDENERGFNRGIDRVINMFTNYIETSE